MPLALAIILWLALLAANGFILFFWLVFALAAMGGAGSPVQAFIGLTALGVAIPVMASFWFFAKGKAPVAVACMIPIAPLSIGLSMLA